LIQRSAPRRPGVVDENVQMVLARANFIRETLALGFGRQIRGQRRARSARGEFFGQRVTDVRFTRRNIYLGTRLDESSRDHLTDAAASAGYQYHLAIDVKERAHQQIVNHRALEIEVENYESIRRAIRGRGSS